MRSTAAEKRERNARPLTPEEARFAEEHIGIVWGYLRARGLAPGDWFDVAAIRYLQAVKRWHEEPELREYSFSTIATAAMRSAIWCEQQKRARRPKTVSLSEIIPGTESLTFEQILAAPAAGR